MFFKNSIMENSDCTHFNNHAKKQVTHLKFVFCKGQSIMMWLESFCIKSSHPMSNENFKNYLSLHQLGRELPFRWKRCQIEYLINTLILDTIDYPEIVQFDVTEYF